MLRSRAFSLIELLVVVSIIAALASLVLTAIPVIRDQAKSLTCSNQLRQIGLGFEAYSGLNEGLYPPALDNPNFYLWLKLYTNEPNSFGFLRPDYLDMDAVIVCPGFPLQNVYGSFASRALYGKRAAGYRYNGSPYTDNSGMAFDTPSVRNYITNGFPLGPSQMRTNAGLASRVSPARVVLAYDAITEDRSSTGVYHGHPVDRITRTAGMIPLVRGGNLLFCDGHVQFLRSADWRAENGSRPNGAYYCPYAGY